MITNFFQSPNPSFSTAIYQHPNEAEIKLINARNVVDTYEDELLTRIFGKTLGTNNYLQDNLNIELDDIKNNLENLVNRSNTTTDHQSLRKEINEYKKKLFKNYNSGRIKNYLTSLQNENNFKNIKTNDPILRNKIHEKLIDHYSSQSNLNERFFQEHNFSGNPFKNKDLISKLDRLKSESQSKRYLNSSSTVSGVSKERVDDLVNTYIKSNPHIFDTFKKEIEPYIDQTYDEFLQDQKENIYDTYVHQSRSNQTLPGKGSSKKNNKKIAIDPNEIGVRNILHTKNVNNKKRDKENYEFLQMVQDPLILTKDQNQNKYDNYLEENLKLFTDNEILQELIGKQGDNITKEDINALFSTYNKQNHYYNKPSDSPYNSDLIYNNKSKIENIIEDVNEKRKLIEDELVSNTHVFSIEEGKNATHLQKSLYNFIPQLLYKLPSSVYPGDLNPYDDNGDLREFDNNFEIETNFLNDTADSNTLKNILSESDNSLKGLLKNGRVSIRFNGSRAELIFNPSEEYLNRSDVLSSDAPIAKSGIVFSWDNQDISPLKENILYNYKDQPNQKDANELLKTFNPNYTNFKNKIEMGSAFSERGIRKKYFIQNNEYVFYKKGNTFFAENISKNKTIKSENLDQIIYGISALNLQK